MMVSDGVKRVHSPAAYVAEHAIAYADADSTAVSVGRETPLPATVITCAAQSVPLQGTTSASTVAGPFAPELGRPIMLTLSGSWSGSAQLLRSTDGGVTKLPITVGGTSWGSYAANCNEAVTTEHEAAARYYLAVTLASGTLAYRIAQ